MQGKPNKKNIPTIAEHTSKEVSELMKKISKYSERAKAQAAVNILRGLGTEKAYWALNESGIAEKVYREKSREYVAKDVESYAENQNLVILPDAVQSVAEAYVDGEYDCNLGYWDNIDNLIREHSR